MDTRLNIVSEQLEAVRASGWAGLLRAVALEVDPNCPSAQCIADADNGMDAAVGAEQYYGAALGMAACLRQADLFAQVPEPEPGEPEPDPEPDPEFGDKPNMADVVLATLLVHLRRTSSTT